MQEPHVSKIAVGHEYNVLSTVIYNVKMREKVLAELQSDDFILPSHRNIFAVMRDMLSKRVNISIGNLVQELERNGLQQCIDTATGLMNSYVTDDYVDHLIEQIKKHSHQRKCFRALSAGTTIFDSADLLENETMSGVYDNILKTFYNLTKNNTMRSLQKAMDNYKESPQRTFFQEIQHRQELRSQGQKIFNGYTTGYKDIDSRMFAFQDTHLTLIGARPGVGKSTFMLNLALYMAKEHKIGVGIFSLEMSTPQLLEKLASIHAEVNSRGIKEGTLLPEEVQRLYSKSNELYAFNIQLDDEGRINIGSLKARAKHWKEIENVKIIFIDYLQLIVGAGKFNNKYEEITKISQDLKGLAKELNIPIIALAQLNRNAANKEGEPKASDLRDSGSLEQDADEILLLHDPEKPGVLKLNIVKNRFGETGPCEVYFDKKTGKIGDLSKDDKEEEERFNSYWDKD